MYVHPELHFVIIVFIPEWILLGLSVSRVKTSQTHLQELEKQTPGLSCSVREGAVRDRGNK